MHVVEADSAGERSFDRADSDAHVHFVGVLPGFDEFLATGEALRDAVGIG